MRKVSSRLSRYGVLAAAGIVSASHPQGGTTQLPEWTLKLQVRIGDEQDPKYTFHRAGALATDAAGRIYIADIGDSRVRVYSPDGRHVRDIGRAGPGPGEFNSLGTVSVHADTLYAVDLRAQRMTLFDTAGAVIRVESTTDYLRRPVSVHRVFPNGRILLSPVMRSSETEIIPRLLVTRSGEILDTMGVPLEAEPIQLEHAGRTIHLNNPFAQPWYLATSASGSWWIDVIQYPHERLKPGEFVLRAIEFGGASGERWSRRFNDRPVEYPRAEKDSIIRRIADSSGGAVNARELAAAAKAPEYRYPVTALVVARNGDIWLRLASEASANRWRVIDAGGNPLASVHLPVGASPQIIIGRERVWVVQRDDFGVQSVVAYALVAGSGRSRD